MSKSGWLGLKENVIIGKLIPAGSGLSKYRSYAEKLVPDREEPAMPAAVGMEPAVSFDSEPLPDHSAPAAPEDDEPSDEA